MVWSQQRGRFKTEAQTAVEKAFQFDRKPTKLSRASNKETVKKLLKDDAYLYQVRYCLYAYAYAIADFQDIGHEEAPIPLVQSSPHGCDPTSMLRSPSCHRLSQQ